MMPRRRVYAFMGATLGAFFIGCGGRGESDAPAGAGGSGDDGGAGAPATGGLGAGGLGTGGSALPTGGAGAGGDPGAPSVCGDEVVEGNEECDDGNVASGDGCENDCTFTCIAGVFGRDRCDDGNPCNGTESCSAANVCVAGTPLGEGEACAAERVCVNGNCVAGSCGDGIVQAPEECDDGNVTPGDGCENDCTFTCVSADTTRDCSGGDACAGTATCDEATHTCTARTPLADETLCAAGTGWCISGVCVASVCGNGITEPGEQCDDGNLAAGDGCENDCTFSCMADTECNDQNVCTENLCDLVTHTCSHPTDAAQEGAPCTIGGASGSCLEGLCTPATCGDGNVDLGEECDNGTDGNGPGTGCTVNCQFECQSDAGCSDGNPCNGAEVCATVAGGKVCQPGDPMSPGDVCAASPRRICSEALACVLSTCGDGFVDTGAGEQCEPPNTETCSATCQTIVPAVCGNGTIEGAEHCDDGSTTNLDGCDSACKYEVFLRMNKVAIARGTAPNFCDQTTNRLGAALSSTAVDQLNPGLQASVDAGNTNIITQALGLDDLTGVADPFFELGVTTGRPDPARGTWPVDGSNPMDWWFLLSPGTLGANLIPAEKLTPASLAARLLNAGPSDISVTIDIGGAPATLEILAAKTRGTVDAATSVPAPPPDALAPGLVVAESITADGTGQGLCGNVTVESLSKIPVPEMLTSGTFACRSSCSNSRAYTYCGEGQPVGPSCNSLLDAVVGGCRATLLCVTAISPSQPDVDNGGPSPLTLGTGNKVPDAQTNGNRNAYSAWFRYTARRIHATGTE
jgi:cysteine-rich repeat protein